MTEPIDPSEDAIEARFKEHRERFAAKRLTGEVVYRVKWEGGAIRGAVAEVAEHVLPRAPKGRKAR